VKNIKKVGITPEEAGEERKNGMKKEE